MFLSAAALTKVPFFAHWEIVYGHAVPSSEMMKKRDAVKSLRPGSNACRRELA